MATWFAVQDLGQTAQGLSNQTSFLRPIVDGTIHASPAAGTAAARRGCGRSRSPTTKERLCALVRMTIAVREAAA